MWAFVAVDDLVSSSLAITEVPRAVRRKTRSKTASRLTAKMLKAKILVSAITTYPVDDAILEHATLVPDPHLGSLDAIHVATALALRPIAAFVTYDRRQARSARMVGLTVRSPGCAQG
jgi:predicted nucleic acid-binding protein